MAFHTKPRVLFSNPPWWVSEQPCALTVHEQLSLRTSGVRAGSRWPFTFTGRSTPGIRHLEDYTPYPFFMGYAATYVAAKTGARVTLRDSIATRETYDNYFLYLLQNRFDIIFVESASPSWKHDARLIQKIKAMLPETVIAVTGPIATQAKVIVDTYLDLEYLGNEVPVTACIKGEYEKGAVRVVEGARGVRDFDLLTRDEMNAAPFPHTDGTTWNHYWDSNPRGNMQPQLQVWSSRGCPYRCIFCVWPAAMTGNDPDGTGKRSVRHYTADYMEAFLSEKLTRYPHFRSVYFDDDTFNLGDRHVLGMCGVMGRLGLPWSAMCRADTIRRDTWRAMKNAGCCGVKIGFESGNQYVVDQIVNKRLDLAEAKDTVAFLHSIGMEVHGTFTYGLPGETREQVQDTKRFIRELQAAGMTTYQESGCAEIEGAPLRTLAERGGTLVAFPGARLDHAYRAMTNGNEKLVAIERNGGTMKYPGNEIEGWMSPEELQWLFETAGKMQSIAEIGSFKGRSAHALCSACPGMVTCIDHFDPEHLRPVARDHVYQQFCENMAQFSNLTVVRKGSVEAAANYPDQHFDMVFIDAGHQYADIQADLHAWGPKARLLLCGHDYTPGWPGVIQAVEEKFPGVETWQTIWFQWVKQPEAAQSLAV